MLCAGMQESECTLRQEASRSQRTITLPQRPSRLDPASERDRTTNQGLLQQRATPSASAQAEASRYMMDTSSTPACLACIEVMSMHCCISKGREGVMPDPHCILTAVAGEGRANGPGRRGQPAAQPPKRPCLDWALGLSVAYDAELLEVCLLLSPTV